MTKKKKPEELRRLPKCPEGYITIRSNGTIWIKRGNTWEYVKKRPPKKEVYLSCRLPKYIPPPPDDIVLHQTKFDGYLVCDNGSIWTEWHRNPHRRGYARKLNQMYRGGSDPNDRYLSVNISIKDENDKTKKQIRYYVHRLIAETLIPNPKELPEIDHINQDKTDNSISNLRWVTRKENMAFNIKSADI